MKQVLIFSFFIFSVCCHAQNISTGADQTAIWQKLLIGKTIGLVVNQTSIIGKTHLVDSMKRLGLKISVIFAPEHGFRGDHSAGTHVNDSIDPSTGIKVISLYGSHKQPTASDLKGIDIVVFDIQDVGVRFYTYISTMHYVMQTCADRNVPFVVFDRPNPNGNFVDGPVLDTVFRSFVGMHPVPLVHGMTTGEFAQMINGEGWLKGKKCALTVVKMLNYSHNTEYILPIKPSPNLQSQQSLYLYPSLGLFEGTTVSIGHGTSVPYESFGWPELKWGNLNFKPVSIKGVVEKPKFKNLECTGFILTNHKMTKWGQNRIELNWLVFSYNESKEKPRFFNDFFDKLAGTDILRKQIIAGLTPDQIRESWVPGLEKFKLMRSKYLLY